MNSAGGGNMQAVVAREHARLRREGLPLAAAVAAAADGH